jgi:hypothetical protein
MLMYGRGKVKADVRHHSIRSHDISVALPNASVKSSPISGQC